MQISLCLLLGWGEEEGLGELWAETGREEGHCRYRYSTYLCQIQIQHIFVPRTLIYLLFALIEHILGFLHWDPLRQIRILKRQNQKTKDKRQNQKTKDKSQKKSYVAHDRAKKCQM